MTNGHEGSKEMTPEDKIFQSIREEFNKSVGGTNLGILKKYLNLIITKVAEHKIDLFHQKGDLRDEEFDEMAQNFENKYEKSVLPNNILPWEIADDLMDRENGWIYRAHYSREVDPANASLANRTMRALNSLVNTQWHPVDIKESIDTVPKDLEAIGDLIGYRYAVLVEHVPHQNTKKNAEIAIEIFYGKISRRPVDYDALPDLYKRFDADRKFFEASEA